MTPTTPTHTATKLSVLASLRALSPHRPLEFDDLKIIAERQAVRLRQLLDAEEGIYERDLANLPRLRIVHDDLPTSGLSFWNGEEWVIALNQSDTLARQRFTLLHEYKHIIDHGAQHTLYASTRQAERMADFFAASVLMPKPELKRVFCNITQRIEQLAVHFGVSQQAVRVRLEQTGLVEPEVFTRERCARPISTPRWQPQQFRQVSMKGAAQ